LGSVGPICDSSDVYFCKYERIKYRINKVKGLEMKIGNSCFVGLPKEALVD